jgi:carbonic anhydrase/acetyltransferase-like protein (isoleucine patch superfamily)
LAREQPSLVDFADVGDEVGLDASRLRHQLSESSEQLSVRNGAKRESEICIHGCNIGRRFVASSADVTRCAVGKNRLARNLAAIRLHLRPLPPTRALTSALRAPNRSRSRICQVVAKKTC